ncbi:DEHA2C14454p [Debaryomyces hansenii CBS767]|uniref:DEHA2C14454p n=1 Tax=Debaryomyces hansenii (strain ATCC 36239 / CBS 767 / BCRC 21394 / JCM 1990 / NBRC 0083 / IGC 2968) TaxID=284592 RepID=Q6BU09_DEBHA|nr:DEHA2C14454p [Debaryomyces hansenii CBS767]CAG86388.2 DEHA2C14454p [Debaryomyces hansenii CBS767]|eukprot:XP_458310.2 DEHA2C14454p [Debaryomyces hansenii CBS767]
MLKKFYICVIFVMQIIMAECQQLYGYTSTDCTGSPSVNIDIGTDNCYTVKISNEGSFRYENVAGGDIMALWDDKGCDSARSGVIIYTQPVCITVNRHRVLSFAIINTTSVSEIIDLRVAAISKNTQIIANNCSLNKY